VQGDMSESESSDSDEDIAKHKKDKKKGGDKKSDKETFWDVFLRRAFVDSGHHLQLDFDRH